MEITTEELQSAVRASLASDPRLPYPDEIAVDAYGGVVTLRGTVGSFAQQRAASADARRTAGVDEVYDELQVRLLDDERREDAESAAWRCSACSGTPSCARTTSTSTSGTAGSR